MLVPGLTGLAPVDDGDAERNHNYMSTRQGNLEAAEAATAAAADPGEDADDDAASDAEVGAGR